MPFPFTFEYVPGSENIVADALSRYPTPASNNVTVISPVMFQYLLLVRKAASDDLEYLEWRQELQQGRQVQIPGLRARVQGANPVVWQDLILLEDQRVLVPNDPTVRTLLLSSAHDPVICGHFGFEKTLEKLARHWWWQGMSSDVKEYVRTCVKCQQMKHDTQRPKGLLQPILAAYPWHTVTLDLVGKFEPGDVTQNTYCLVIVDKFSKYTILQSVPEACDAKLVADIFIKQVIATFGVPVRVISDRGPQFTATLMASNS